MEAGCPKRRRAKTPFLFENIAVIPGRAEREPGISRFRVWSFGPSRNDAAERAEIWHRRRSCGIQVRAPGARRHPDSLLASHFSAGDFFMRRSILTGAVMATLVASFAADAQQPMQRVQVGVL